MFDLLIKGGSVINGLGEAPRIGDVAVTRDRIADVGDLHDAHAHETLDASGMLVCPGFIDVHSHSDTYFLIEPQAACKLYQGVTTEIVGNCGASAAPLAGDYRMPSDWADKTYPGKWNSVSEYRVLLEAARPAINVVLLIGHNTLRVGAMGYGDRHASADELALMEHRLEQSLDEGGRGLSSGLAYVPGIFAPPEELIRLARVVARKGGIYTSHMRSESGGLLESVEETLAVGRQSGVPVQVSHFKACGKENWHLLEPAIAQIEAARESGMSVAADRYPYTCSCTSLDIIFPAWSEDGGRFAVLERLRDPALRARIREDLLSTHPEDYWDTVTIGSTTHPDNRGFRGQRLVDVAATLGLEPADAVLHLTDTDDLETTAFFFGMSEANMLRVFDLPYVMLGSDGSLRAPVGPLSEDHPHPRAYGSFPRFLRMALDGKTVPLVEAVRKMTSLSAETFGLTDRGIIARHKRADLVVLDPTRVIDKSTYGAPHQYSEGVSHVVVNGVVTLRDGQPSGARAGIFL
ncbi:MAG: D-aminoacylase [Verrucomicrobia bacterium]|nr:D-aminoacylase [Verrucomicrobiota bacterium]